MSEWTKQRRCEKCGASFTLEDHGHQGAQLAAESLERGTGPVEGADYFALRFCPTHRMEAASDALREAMKKVAGNGHSINDVTPKQAVFGWILLAVVVALGIIAWKFMF